MATKTRQGPWTVADVPGQQGRTAVVTGANTGIGFETAAVLAQRGAATVLACRDTGKAERAAARLSAAGTGAERGRAPSGGGRRAGADAERGGGKGRARGRERQSAGGGKGTAVPQAAISVVRLDLASLESVRAAAAQIWASHERLDLLINNAGVMMPPRATTADGFELQLGTNHLGHFALTGLLLEALLAVPGSRVVTVSSHGHRAGRINFADLQSERRYGRLSAYAQSKLANLMFTYELERRLRAAGAATIAVAAHPGSTSTELVRHLPGLLQTAYTAAGELGSQSATMGALPTLRAATDPAARGGDYYGPGGWAQLKGYPVRVSSNGRSHDEEAQRRLWAESERLTGVTFPV